MQSPDGHTLTVKRCKEDTQQVDVISVLIGD